MQDKFDKNKIKMQQVQHFVLFVQPSAKYNAACKKKNVQTMTNREQHAK
jgi:hypothetical protein